MSAKREKNVGNIIKKEAKQSNVAEQLTESGSGLCGQLTQQTAAKSHPYKKKLTDRVAQRGGGSAAMMAALLEDATIHNRLHPFSVSFQRRLLRQQALKLTTN